MKKTFVKKKAKSKILIKNIYSNYKISKKGLKNKIQIKECIK